MKTTCTALCAILLACPAFRAAAQSVPFVREPDKTVYLYPKGQDTDMGIEGITLGPGVSTGEKRPELFGEDLNLRNVSDSARFDLYFAENPNGVMVIICPGGAYWVDAVITEGAMAAQWLNSRGVSAAVVKYRLPHGRHTAPLRDVQNVFRYCRHFAGEWGMDLIGVMGFSAGGHLAATASTLFTDEITRPDFSILFYPVISTKEGIAHEGSFNNLIGSGEAWKDRPEEYRKLRGEYSLEERVRPDTPRTFIVFSSDDNVVPTGNEILYYNALQENGVPCEMHAFPTGGHGYGFRDSKYLDDPLKDYREELYDSLSRFLRQLKAE